LGLQISRRIVDKDDAYFLRLAFPLGANGRQTFDS